MTETEYRVYAEKVWSEITKVLWVLDEALYYLPIVFTKNPHARDVGKQGITFIHTYLATGRTVVFPVISLAGDTDFERVKTVIRHELIHFILALQYKCDSDDSAVFWLVCGLFNGEAYLPMSKDSKELFMIAAPYLKQAYEDYSATENTRIALNISLMLSAVDTLESTNNIDTEKLTSDLSIISDAIDLIKNTQ